MSVTLFWRSTCGVMCTDCSLLGVRSLVAHQVRSKDREDAFTIRHYAGDVVYRASGWLEKARGVVRGDLQGLLDESDCPLLKSVPSQMGGTSEAPQQHNGPPSSASASEHGSSGPAFDGTGDAPAGEPESSGGLGALLKSLGKAVGTTIESHAPGAGSLASPESSTSRPGVHTDPQRAGTKRSTVGTRFAAELASLVRLLSRVSSRFIRCLKPNMLKVPDAFDGGAVLRQLRYTGMLECIHILRVGFPVSLKYPEAVRLLHPLATRLMNGQDCPVHDVPSPDAEHTPAPSVAVPSDSHAPVSRTEQGEPRLEVFVEDVPLWLAPLLNLETEAAQDALPITSVERDATPWAIGKTKLFLRGFLFVHLNRKRELVRGRAARRLQQRQRHRVGLRTSARQQLLLLVVDGTEEQLRRILPKAKAAGAPADVVSDAQDVLMALTSGARLRTALEAALDRHNVKALGSAVAESVSWLEVNSSAAAHRALPWVRVEMARVNLREWQSGALMEALESGVESQSVDHLHEALGAARTWLQGVETEGPPQVEAVAAAVSDAAQLLEALMSRASAAQDLVGIMARGATADPAALTLAIECAERHEVEGRLITKARELQAELVAAAAERKRQEERRKREAEAAVERERRVARQSVIETKRLSAKAQVDMQRSFMRAKEEEEDAALLAAAGGTTGTRPIPSSGVADEGTVGSGPRSLSARAVYAAGHGAAGVPPPIPEAPSMDVAESSIFEALAESDGTQPPQRRGDDGGVEKSGWLLKTGPVSSWKPPKWSQRFFVLVGGTLYYYRPQELDEQAGRIELSSQCTISEGVTLRSSPAGAFAVSVPAQSSDEPGVRVSARTYRMSAGSTEEMRRWVAAIRMALGQPARESPPTSALEHMATLTGSVTAAGGSSFAVRIQKHLAMQQASDEDLSSLLGRRPGLLLAFRAMLTAHGHAHGDASRADVHRRCCVIAAKVGVLLRCRLLSPEALEPCAAALRQACEQVRHKESIVRPKDRGSSRLLPGAVAVDSSDPFHVELASSIRSVGSALGATLAPYLSEATMLQLQDVFGAISGQDVLTALFGNALRPAAGIACSVALQELMLAAALWCEAEGCEAEGP